MTIAYCVFVVAILPYVWSMAWRWPVYRLKANLSPGVSKIHQRAGASKGREILECIEMRPMRMLTPAR